MQEEFVEQSERSRTNRLQTTGTTARHYNVIVVRGVSADMSGSRKRSSTVVGDDSSPRLHAKMFQLLFGEVSGATDSSADESFQTQTKVFASDFFFNVERLFLHCNECCFLDDSRNTATTSYSTLSMEVADAADSSWHFKRRTAAPKETERLAKDNGSVSTSCDVDVYSTPARFQWRGEQ